MPFSTVVAFAASVDQDQAAQKIHPDFPFTLSALVKTLDICYCEFPIISIIFPGIKFPMDLFGPLRVNIEIPYLKNKNVLMNCAEPSSSVGSIADLTQQVAG